MNTMTEKEIDEQRKYFRVSFQFDEYYVYGRRRTVAIRKFKTKQEAEEFCDRLARIPRSHEMRMSEMRAALGEGG